MLIQVFFWWLALVLLGSGIGVITSRNPVFSALFLVLAFVTSAFLWMLLEAEFLAIVLVLVYVGAVMVLFLFVVMMLDVNLDTLKEGFVRFAPVGAIVALVMVAELVTVFWVRTSGLPVLENPPPHPADYSNTEALGAVLYTEHVYAFELASFILLLAIVAAIVLTMRKRPGLKQQNIARQVAVRRQDRVRIVSMDAEREAEDG
jgi:NADH-quinone oxidoreductase subunit J